MKKTPSTINAIPATPPTTPPAMAATGVLESPDVGTGRGVGARLVVAGPASGLVEEEEVGTGVEVRLLPVKKSSELTISEELVASRSMVEVDQVRPPTWPLYVVFMVCQVVMATLSQK
jgi:hypothetical protein